MISVRDLIFEDTEPSEEDRAIHIISFSDEATDDDILIAKMRYKHVITYGINKNCDIIKGDPDVPYMKVGKPLTQEMIDRLNLLREQLDDKKK